MDITKTTVVNLGVQGNVTENMEPVEGSAAIYRDIINAAPNAFPVRFKDGELAGRDGLNNPYKYAYAARLEEDHRQYVACQPDDQSGFLVHYSRPFGQSELCLRCRELFGGEPFAQYQLLRSHGPRSGRRAYPHRMAGRPEAGVPGLQPVRQRHPHAARRGGCQLQPDVRRKTRSRRSAARLCQRLSCAGGYERLSQVAA